VPGRLGDDPELEAILGVGPRIAVLDEDVTALEVGLQTDLQQLEVLGVERLVVLTPPDLVLARGFADDELSLAERPVYWPVRTTSGPRWATAPSRRRIASSYSSGVDKLWKT
jgi:hypothetical protein